MRLTWKEEHLDFVSVPSGLLIMLGYHLLKPVIGYENHNRRACVARILQVEAQERGPALAVISSNLSAASSLASISLTLSSLIGAWIGSSYNNDYITSRIYGNTSATIIYLKYIGLLSRFTITFACFVQAQQCFVRANFLISMPNCEMPVAFVEGAVISRINFWVVGQRSLYFASNLLLWIFGPIPIFVSSVITVVLLYFLDKNAAPLPEHNRPVSYDYSSKKADRETAAATGTPRNSPNGTPDIQR